MPDPQILQPPSNPFKKVGAKASRATLLALIAILLSLSTGALYWFSWSQTQLLKNKVDRIVETVSREEKGYLQALNTQSETLQDKIDTLQQQLNAVQNKINSLTNSTLTEQDTLKQTAYLIQMADLQLIIGKNPKAALALLKLANEQLETLPTKLTQSVRSLVTQHIELLEKTSFFNPNELIKKLDKLNEQIYALPALPTLPADQPTPPDQTSSDQTPSPPTNNSWKEKIKKISDNLKKLVIIRRNEQPVKSLLSSEQLALLKESIRLKINSAQWAVLHQDTELYQQSLVSAKNWLETYYPNQKNTEEILETIQELSKANLAFQSPDLKDVLSAIQSLIYSPEPAEKTKNSSGGK